MKNNQCTGKFTIGLKIFANFELQKHQHREARNHDMHGQRGYNQIKKGTIDKKTGERKKRQMLMTKKE